MRINRLLLFSGEKSCGAASFLLFLSNLFSVWFFLLRIALSNSNQSGGGFDGVKRIEEYRRRGGWFQWRRRSALRFTQNGELQGRRRAYSSCLRLSSSHRLLGSFQSCEHLFIFWFVLPIHMEFDLLRLLLLIFFCLIASVATWICVNIGTELRCSSWSRYVRVDLFRRDRLDYNRIVFSVSYTI